MIQPARVASHRTPNLFAAPKLARPKARQLGLVVARRMVPLRHRDTFCLGSDPQCDIVVRDRHVSARHCSLERGARGWVLRDTGSTNGTWLDGKRVSETPVREGQVFCLGRVPVLVVETAFSRRYPNAFRWHQMILLAERSLDLITRIAQAATQDVPVLLLGESGCGKERAAHALHGASKRAGGPWVALNCAALPDTLAEGELFGVERGAFTGADRSRSGVFERASGGSLFLDEVGELSGPIQAKLLRVLEEKLVTPIGSSRPRAIDVRVIAATWRDLQAPHEGTAFRHDLFQRLAVFPIEIPSLRTRKEEIGPLVEAFFEARGLADAWPSPEILRAMTHGHWPGNVRELRNRVIRCACSGDPKDLLPDNAQCLREQMSRRGHSRRPVGRTRVRYALDLNDGNRSAAARDLGISRSTLYRWLKSTTDGA